MVPSDIALATHPQAGMQIPFFSRLEPSESVLLVGCGGGFDVVSGIPLLVWLLSQGKRVTLGNVSFANVNRLCNERVGPLGWVVDGECGEADYFPERALWTWLRERGTPLDVIAFERGGVAPLRASFQAAAERCEADTIVLVDGGTDSLLKGDEADLATVEEDAASILAANALEVPLKLLACLGFGIDTFHGLCHHSFLENVAEVTRKKGFLGCVSVDADSPEGTAFLGAVDALMKVHSRGSIVQTSIASAMEGAFGDVHRSRRTEGSKLFINPLMTTYWTFSLPHVAAIMGYPMHLADTTTIQDVGTVIRLHHSKMKKRGWTPLPY